MRTNLTILALLSLIGAVAPAAAQTTVTGNPATGGASSATSGSQNAVTRPNTDHAVSGRPGGPGAVKLEPGANSFTEGETRRRLEQAGFKEVKDLRKDDQGIWRGMATRDGKPTRVGLDFKGNVAAP
ncbi:hypothetical protein OPKNFCMD_5259 [Methylobacterium crusticola]|uniref:PepSY domain-containing protein n=1 Tax=Methylobacterium crusticola TaxID=1697972 RepID=A0ABQ4R477_9HYPH|nr:hypothetical protein [Methylobacterium crusticola]GJD52493.1 hypothetical protein OPKNFCMD_5259 [Methylobacterium crusticola]